MQTHEEATVYVKELDILNYESLQKHASSVVAWKVLQWKRIFLWMLMKNGIRIPCNTENFVPIVAPGLSTSSSSDSYHSTSMTLSRQASHCSASSSSSSSSPTVSDTKTPEREDRIESDTSPVAMSTTIDERSGRPDVDQAKKTPKNHENSLTKNGETCCW